MEGSGQGHRVEGHRVEGHRVDPLNTHSVKRSKSVGSKVRVCNVVLIMVSLANCRRPGKSLRMARPVHGCLGQLTRWTRPQNSTVVHKPTSAPHHDPVSRNRISCTRHTASTSGRLGSLSNLKGNHIKRLAAASRLPATRRPNFGTQVAMWPAGAWHIDPVRMVVLRRPPALSPRALSLLKNHPPSSRYMLAPQVGGRRKGRFAEIEKGVVKLRGAHP